MQNKRLLKKIIKRELTNSNVSLNYIFKDLMRTKKNWKIKKSLLEIWIGEERDYYNKFAMNAFDSGYCGYSL